MKLSPTTSATTKQHNPMYWVRTALATLRPVLTDVCRVYYPFRGLRAYYSLGLAEGHKVFERWVSYRQPTQDLRSAILGIRIFPPVRTQRATCPFWAKYQSFHYSYPCSISAQHGTCTSLHADPSHTIFSCPFSPLTRRSTSVSFQSDVSRPFPDPVFHSIRAVPLPGSLHTVIFQTAKTWRLHFPVNSLRSSSDCPLPSV